jgi:hypothetical protein
MHANFSAASSSGVRDAAAEFWRVHSDLSPTVPNGGEVKRRCVNLIATCSRFAGMGLRRLARGPLRRAWLSRSGAMGYAYVELTRLYFESASQTAANRGKPKSYCIIPRKYDNGLIYIGD